MTLSQRKIGDFAILIYRSNMCLYPRMMKNPKYIGEKRQLCTDARKLYVPIGCGNCYECRKQLSNNWKVRLNEELKVNEFAYFVTLTFAPEELEKLMKETKKPECNGIATLAVRRMLERWRQKKGKSLKHWLITELGQTNTERIHLHGILFPEEPMTNEELHAIWKYGNTDIGKFCNSTTIGYIVKYITKVDTLHKNYKAKVLCSPGIGSNFVKTLGAQRTYKYKVGETPEFYTLQSGRKVALPLYYRNKLYSDEERERMWTDRLNKGIIYVNGIKCTHVDTTKGYQEYMEVLEEQQRQNEKLGYGTPREEWTKEEYNINFKMLQKKPNTKK